MTDAELDRLADLIARALIDRHTSPPETSRSETWLPVPVRPAPPSRGGDPPTWAGAAQQLGDVAPSRGGDIAPPRFRASTGELTRATRAAAAGKGKAPERASREPASRLTRQRPANAPAIDVRVGVSNRHIHLSAGDLATLLGSAPLTSARALTQPGQFAAAESIAVQGPKGRLDSVRIVGPARGETQLEIAMSDAAMLGVEPPVAASGSLDASVGGVTLIGPAGRVELRRGVIIAARHLHLSPVDAKRWGLRDGDRLDVRCGSAGRAATLHDVLVRSGDGHATELHLDADEARAVGVKTGDTATVIGWRSPAAARRPLVTERDVVRIAREGGRVPANAILTPSARDRAAALGILER
jgi:putative phosphotransacetylase